MDIAVNGIENVYITGWIYFVNFPTTPGTFDPTYNGSADAFVLKLNPGGSSLAYATFLGGNGSDSGDSVAVDTMGNAYIAGQTDFIANFPTTSGVFDCTYNGDFDSFVAKISPIGSSLVYSSFLGGNFYEYGASIGVDDTRMAYITGHTNSANFPTTPGSFDTTLNGSFDSFVGQSQHNR